MFHSLDSVLPQKNCNFLMRILLNHFIFSLLLWRTATVIGREGSDVFSYYENTALQANWRKALTWSLVFFLTDFRYESFTKYVFQCSTIFVTERHSVLFQARTHQLLVHNKDLLEHIAALVAHLQERERGSSKPINAQQLTLLPQVRTKT